MNEMGLRRIPPDQSSGSGHTFGTLRHPSIGDPILSKRVCFYKSGDPQFNGLRLIINNRTFKTFDALLDSLSKKVPLAFGVRNITTPHGVHAISSLDELEDGKSYICSDRRKVKPINLVMARKKLPPWHHARPVSSRRRTVQQARFFPGRNIHKTQPAVLRTPKRLLVFRNGEPAVNQTVVLHKTTPSYESILEYISELMQFHVVKLHTPDGKRVEGLPGLILCSGTVVAVGREAFIPAIYTPQKTLSAARRHARRQKSSTRKKKLPPYGSNLRNFSASSERYIVDQIHNTIAGSSNGFPSNLTNSLELESSRILESVVEMEEDNNLDDGVDRQTCSLPNENDIEKSFRVNQDGSMTVEMRVRLTIKEEETVHWTTTLQRSSVANQLDSAPLPEPEAMDGICSPNSTSVELQNSVESSNETIHRDKPRDNNDDDPPSPSNEAFNESCNDEDESKPQTDMVFPSRAPTPGQKQMCNKQTSTESIKSVTTHGILEDVVSSYSFREQTENGSMTEQYCVMKQSSSRPVPKPRRLGSVEQASRNVSRFTSEGMSEVLQIESSGEEVTETVLHIYEQQTCHDNFLPNVCAPYMSVYKNTFGRPATSETGRLSSSNEFEPELCRPSTASEIISIWRTESMSATSELKSPSQESVVNKSSKGPKQRQKAKKAQVKVYQGEDHKVRRASPKHKVINKHIRRIVTPVKKKRTNSAGAPESHRKTKTFSSAGFLKRIYGNKSKSVKSLKNLKKRPSQNATGNVSKDGFPDDAMTSDENKASVQTGRIDVSTTELNQPRGILMRQTSMHMEKKNENTSYRSNESSTQSTFERTNNYAKEYVENWLEKAHLNLQTENIGLGVTENKQDLISEADEVKCSAERLKTEIQQACESQSHNVLGTSVRLKVQSFENKSLNSPVEKMAASHNLGLDEENSINTDKRSLIRTHAEDIKLPPMNGILPEMLSQEKKQNKSNPVKILFQEDTPSRTLSMDLPPPPSSAEMAALSNPEYFMRDVSSAASSAEYKMSSRTETHAASVTSTSDNVLSPNDNAAEITSSLKADIPSDQRESPLPRDPSIKRVPLVSNQSLERKMSLRKASLDKHTLSITVNTASDDAPLTGTEQAEKTTSDLISTQSCCTSVSPTSLTSEERSSSGSISSNEDLVMRDLLWKDVKLLNGESLPKTSVKKVTLVSSPSPERKLHSKKSPPELLKNSPKSSPVQSRPSKQIPPGVGIHQHMALNVSPPAGRKQKIYKPKQPKRLSPYSQSLDVASPPARHRASQKLPLRNLSLESPSETANKKNNKKKILQARTKRQSVKSANELDKTVMSDASISLETGQRENGAAPAAVDKEKATAVMPDARSLATTDQLNMKPVLEKICYSIKSIRQMTQGKRPSCLEKSNSVPDFSSHVASTFGSSSKALLAFLSVMTLKEGLTGLNVDGLHTNSVSCAEALKMIDSLTEIANIEDSHTLKTSLADLQQSTSKQLLRSWKGFRDLSDRCKSRNSAANDSEDEHKASPSPDEDPDLEDSVIDELMDVLEIPEKLKVELASLSEGAKSGNAEQIPKRVVKESHEDYLSRLSTEGADNARCADKLNVDVKSIIQKFTHNTQPEPSLTGSQNLAENCKTVDGSTKDTDPQKSATKRPREQQLQCQSQSFVQGNFQSNRNVVNQENQSEPEETPSQEDICEQSAAVQDTHERKTSKVVQASDEKFPLLESQTENDDTKRPNLCHNVEANPAGTKTMSSSDRENQDTAGVKCDGSDREKQKPSMGLNISTEDSTDTAEDVEELSSEEEEQPEVESKQLQVIVEETSSGIEEEDEEVEEHVYAAPKNREHAIKFNTLEAVNEEAEEDNAGSGNENKTHVCHQSKSIRGGDGHVSLEKGDSCKGRGREAKRLKFNTDDDSGNDHRSCEEHGEEDQPKIKYQDLSCSMEDLSDEDRESSSDEEEVDMRCRQECAVTEKQSDIKCEVTMENEIKTQSVAERVILLEQQVADSQKRTHSTRGSEGMYCSQRSCPLESEEEEESESPTSSRGLCTRSAPQSSLSFSYDSSGVVTTEPEGRVRSIREMFLAKSVADIQPRRVSYSNASELQENRGEASVSGGYYTQTSSEVSTGEDDSARQSIAKGFVRRTIERLYGKKDARRDEEAGEVPPPAPKHKNKEHSSLFSSLQMARSKAMSELSYFNSAHALTEATRCIAFNAQVGPGDSVPIDNGRWLLRENTLIRKSISDPAGINKTFSNAPEGEKVRESREEDAPYSLFSTKSDPEDNAKSAARKCTYFSLPNFSDSDVCQDEAVKGSLNGDAAVEVRDDSEERNGKPPRAGVTDFKKTDNKVHPLAEPASAAEVVVVQPAKGQGAVNRRLQDPDMLDFLYDFCGQNCPIL